MRHYAVALLLLTACAGGPALAENAPEAPRLCSDRPSLLKALSRRYEEAPTAIGLTSAGGVIELLTSEKGRTWTLIVTRPDGVACLFAVGEGWEPVEKQAAGAAL